MTLKQVELALNEAGAKYTLYTIDLHNKPAFYKEKVNPRGKVSPVLSAYVSIDFGDLTQYHGQRFRQ